MWYWWILGFLAFMGLLVGVSFILSSIIIKPRRDTREQAIACEIERGNLTEGEIDSLTTQEGALTAFDGVKLRYTWLRCADETQKVCVIVHGFGSRWEHVVKYAKLYLARGYDALLFDHRGSGESGGIFTTMGFKERRDLHDLVMLARRDKGFPEKECVVGVHGESMGGATVLLTACMEEPPDFVVADCPYADLSEQLRYSVRHVKHLPSEPFEPVASLITRIRAGFRYSDVSPIREIKKKDGLPDIPILFIHGEDDKLIPASATKRLYEAKRGVKEMCIFPGAGHSRSLISDRERYKRVVYAFLDRCGY